MRAKSVLLLVVALGFGVIASVAVSQVLNENKNRGAVQTVGILVVAKDLSAATKLPADAFRVEQWPVDRVPLGALSDPKMAENKFTKQRLYAGEPIIEAKLSSKGKEFSVPAGYRIFDITVRDETGGGGYIGPGDHIDIFGYFEKGTRINAAKSVKVMENLEVVMVDGVAVVDPESTKSRKSSTIQLLVKDSQYIVLDTASNLGKLRLALRPPEQVAVDGNKTDDGEKFIAWLKESESQPQQSLPQTVSGLSTNLPEKVEKHEMVIVSPGKSTKYRWTDGEMMPQIVDMSKEAEAVKASSDESANQVRPSYPTSFKGSNTRVSGDSEGAMSEAPVDPANSVQPNMTWDPASSTWQTGGFKASYPSSE